MKNLVYSNKEYAIVTISIRNLFIKWFNNTEKEKESSLFVTGKSADPCAAQQNCQYFHYRQSPTG